MSPSDSSIRTYSFTMSGMVEVDGNSMQAREALFDVLKRGVSDPNGSIVWDLQLEEPDVREARL